MTGATTRRSAGTGARSRESETRPAEPETRSGETETQPREVETPSTESGTLPPAVETPSTEARTPPAEGGARRRIAAASRAVLTSGAVRIALLWIGCRAALAGFVLLAAWSQSVDPDGWTRGATGWAVERFAAWDGRHFVEIATTGYPPEKCCPEAFLPGYPLLIRGLAAVAGIGLATAGLLISAVAGIAVAVLLWRVAGQRGQGPELGRRAVVYLAVAPYGVFLTAVYTESPFLAFSLGAWLAGLRRRWWLAGALTAGAVAIRVNGLFLLAALIVMYLVQNRQAGRRLIGTDALAFVLPLEMWAAISTYFWNVTGSWNAWQVAQAEGWGRRAAPPWEGLRRGWSELTADQPPAWVLASAGSFATVVIGVGFVLAFAYLRRWPELVYMTLNVAVLVCSTTFVSAARYGLLWFPAFLLVAELTGRAPAWVHRAVVVACLPLVGVLSLTFGQHGWVA